MINYKGFNVPDTFNEIVEVHKSIGAEMLPTLGFIDKDRMTSPFFTSVSLEEASSSTFKVDDYTADVKDFIDSQVQI